MTLTLPPRVTDRAFDRLAEIAALTKAKHGGEHCNSDDKS
jgi:hypothetical protein